MKTADRSTALEMLSAERRRRADTVSSIARPVAWIAAAVAIVCLVPGFSPTPVAGFVGNMCGAAMAALSVHLARKGKATAAGILFLALVTFLFGSGFWMFGGLLGQYVAFFPMLVCLAGFSLGNRWGIGIGAFLCAIALGWLVLHRLGHAPAHLDPTNALNGAVIACSATITTALFVGRALKLLERYNWEMHRLERERELAQRLEALGRLAGGVAHDLNNLLTPVMGHNDLIRLEPDLSPQVRASSEQIAEAAQRAAGLVKQLLTFARRETEAPADLELDAVVREFAPLLEKLLPGNIVVKLQLECGDKTIRGYRIQIEQIVLNLVINARDAMPDGGTIRIETKGVELDASQCERHAGLTPGRYLRLAVVDDGVGMTPEVQARLFEPFFTTKAVGKGTGLGLATIHGIVQRAGGHVLVQSEPGRGSTFEALLPA